jgi:hypothetical protein
MTTPDRLAGTERADAQLVFALPPGIEGDPSRGHLFTAVVEVQGR